MDELTKLQAELIKELGIFGIKTLLAVNSGAALGLLALMGNLASKDVLIEDLVSYDLSFSMTSFIIGIIFAIFSIAVTYIAVQMRIAGKLHISFWCHMFLMIFPAFLSLGAFVIGCWFAVSAFMPAVA